MVIKRAGLVVLTAVMLAGASSVWADDEGGWLPWRWGKSHNEGGREGNRYQGEGNRYQGEGNRYQGGGGRNMGWAGGAEPAAYQKECASCHIAYPAGLLPAGSWQHLMANLGKHFGSDASLDAASEQAITQFLVGNAGTYKRVSEMPPEDRITQSYWFARKHDRHVSPNVWSRASVNSRSNCSACHPDAQAGSFNEHSVRIPG